MLKLCSTIERNINNINERLLCVNRADENSCKKYGKYGHSYVKHISDILRKTEYQKFNIYSLLDRLMGTYAKNMGMNFIVTDKGCRNQRYRDRKKGVFKNGYVLRPHYSKECLMQKWIVGAPSTLYNDVLQAKSHGPKDFYLPTAIERSIVYFASAICRLLTRRYNHEIDQAELRTLISQKLYLINKDANSPINKKSTHAMLLAVDEFLSIGWKNHIAGGPFARCSGRPSNRVTIQTTRPRLFKDFLISEAAHVIINESMKDISRNYGIGFNKKIKQLSIKSICKYYASDLYHKNITAKNYTTSREILKHCIDEVLLVTMYGANANVHNLTDNVHNLTDNVHNPLNSASHSIINTEHCFYKDTFNKINDSKYMPDIELKRECTTKVGARRPPPRGGAKGPFGGSGEP